MALLCASFGDALVSKGVLLASQSLRGRIAVWTVSRRSSLARVLGGDLRSVDVLVVLLADGRAHARLFRGFCLGTLGFFLPQKVDLEGMRRAVPWDVSAGSQA